MPRTNKPKFDLPKTEPGLSLDERLDNIQKRIELDAQILQAHMEAFSTLKTTSVDEWEQDHWNMLGRLEKSPLFREKLDS